MKDKANLSLPVSKKVCGYEIKKMPIGKYLTTMRRLKELPNEFLETCFPNKSLKEVLDALAVFDETMLKALAFNLIYTIPEYAMDVVAELTEIPRDSLENDANIGIDGLIDIVDAFVEVNQLGKCMREGAALIGKLKANIPLQTLNTGSKE